MIKTKLRTRILCSFVFFTLIITITFTSIGLLLLQDAEDIITDQQLDVLVKNSKIESLEGVSIYEKKSDIADEFELSFVPDQPGTYEFFANDQGKQAIYPDSISARWDMWVTNPREREYRIIIPPVTSNKDPKKWIVVDLTNSEHTEANMYSLSVLFYILLGVFLIIAIATSLLVARWVMKPVIKLSASIKSSEKDTPLNLPTYSDDELGYLAKIISQYDKDKFNQIKREQAFISDCSHELRTPITIINNSVGILNELSIDDERREKVMARVTRSGKRMQRLAQTFLLISKNKQAEFEEIILKNLIDEAIEEIRSLNPNHELTVKNLVPNDLTIESRRESVSVLCHNLIGNCFQHLQSGELVISTELENERLKLSFADNGPGFYQPLEDKGNTVGYGIGLMLIERLCQREKWNLKLEANQPQGAKISINLK